MRGGIKLAGIAALAAAAILPGAPASAQLPETDNFTAPMPPIEGRRVALVIGVSDYRDDTLWSDLPNATNDAAHIAEVLSNPDRGAARFEVELVTNGSREEILARLSAFAEKAEAAEVAVVYFSGHGFEFNLVNYIVPADAPGNVDESSVGAYYIAMSDVVGAAEARGVSLFFLDACRDPGPVLRWSSRTSGDRTALFGAINAPESVVIYATAMGEVAYDAAPPGSQLSPFAQAVARGMNARGLDLPYMFSRVRDQVVRATKAFDPLQRPQLAGSWSRPFYFLPPGEIEAAETLRPARKIDLDLETMSRIDEPVLITRVLEEHEPAAVIAMAEAGDPIALYLVGYMFEFGVGVERDLGRAHAWLERAAATGHPAGQLELGYFLAHQAQGLEERARALALYRSAAEQDYAKAKSHLASALLLGTLGETDREEALQLYREAAALGHAYAHYALALAGEPSGNLAALEQLASTGSEEGHHWLCESAARGLPVDTPFRHCLAAAQAGYANSRANTALLYLQGIGTEASPSRARYWARLAWSAHDLDPTLRTRLTPLID